MIDNEVFFAGEIITDYTRPQHTHRIKISEIFNPYKEFDTMTDRDFSKTDVSLDQLKVQVIVELGRTVTDLRKIACAEKGAIFELDKFDGESVDVFANNVLFAKGEVVVIDENFGIRLTEILPHSLPEAETGSLLSPAHKLSKEAVFWEIGGQDEKNEAGENSAGI
jgi:flagellar motor switch protein FliN